MGTETCGDQWTCWHRVDGTRLSPPLKFQRFVTRQHATVPTGFDCSCAHNRLVPGSNPGGPTWFSPAMPRTSALLNPGLRDFEPSAGTRRGQTEPDFRLAPPLFVAR